MYKRSCKKAFVVALGVAILYTLCTLLYVFFPEKAAMLGAQLHMMKPMVFGAMINIDWTSYLSGVAQIFVMVYILIMLICALKCMFRCCKCCPISGQQGNHSGDNCRKM